jgi:hypothetical protein
MKHNKVIGIAAAALLAVNSMAATAAPAIRPGVVSLPKSAGAFGGTAVRAGKPLRGEQSDLLGAPLLIAFLGAVAVTIGTIVIVNNGDSSPS